MSGTGDDSHRGRLVDASFAGLMALAAVLRMPRRWLPLGDFALSRMWTAAVGTTRTPLVGPDSRFGWNHLGPWLFYLFAIPYRILGGSPVGILVAAAALNVVAAVMVVRCVRDVAGTMVGACTGAAIVVFLCTAAGDRLIDPWNPYVVQLAALLVMVGTWAALEGRLRWVPWVAGAGSLAVQSHITFLVPVAVCVAGCAWAIRSAVADARRPVMRRTGVVLLVAWFPAAIDLALPHRHNAAKVVRWFVAPGGASSPRIGWKLAADVILRETGVGSSWLGGRLPLAPLSDAFTGGLGLIPGAGLAVLAVAAWVARRTRSRRLGALVVLVAVLLAFGLVEMAAGRGELYPYLFGWITITGMLCWVSGVLAVVEWRGAAHAVTWPAAALQLGAVAVLVTTATVQGAPRSPRERVGDGRVAQALTTEAEARLSRSTTYELVHGSDAASSIYELGIVAELRADGFHVVVEPAAVVLFGRHMIDEHAASDPQLSVVEPFEAVAPGHEVIALSDPLTPAQRSREASLEAVLASAYRAAGADAAASVVSTADGSLVLLAGFVHPDPSLDADLRELADLRARGRSVAVELAPAAT